MSNLNAYQMIVQSPGHDSEFQLREFEPDAPGYGEVRIIQKAIGVNFIDIYLRQGVYPWPVDSNFTLGCEAAGIIDSVGQGVTTFKSGDRVAYVSNSGAYATHRIMHESSCVSIPDAVSFEVAAASLLKGLTARFLIHDSYKVEAGETVLVHAAAGGVGSLMGQWLSHLGVHAIGTAGGSEKCKSASTFGYEYIIDYDKEDFVSRTLEFTFGKGVHAVYDSVGKKTMAGSVDCLRRFGTLVSFGQSSGVISDIGPAQLARGSLRMTRPTLFHFIDDPAWLRVAAAEFFELVRNETLSVAYNKNFTLDNVNNAHRALENRETVGSTVLCAAAS